MLQLFQIGNFPIHFHQQKWPGWDVKGRSKTTDALWSSEFFFQNRQYQPDQQSYKINAIVIDEAGVDARQQVDRLKRLIDAPTTVIAYDLHSSGDYDSCFCQAYGTQEVAWYSTVGVLTGVSEDAGAQDVIEVTLSITLNPFWTVLNRYLWSWQGGDFDPLYPPSANTPYANYLSRYPNAVGEFGAFHWSRRPVDRLVAYDPDLWSKLHVNTGLELVTGYGATWGGTYHSIPIAEGEWSAPPLSIYAFKTLPTSGAIEIRVTSSTGLYGRTMHSDYIDLTATNTKLLAVGLAAIQTTDIIYVGDVYPKPGFILRNGAVLSIAPVVSYTGLWPGQLAPGNNGIIFTLPAYVQAAYLHSFRRM